jgi:hypothetical protein
MRKAQEGIAQRIAGMLNGNVGFHRDIKQVLRNTSKVGRWQKR